MNPRLRSRRLTLRRSLVLGIVALLAAVTIVIGVVSVFALQGFLVGRLDSQLVAATSRSQIAFEGGRPDGFDPTDRPPATGFLGIPGQSSGTLGAIVSGGQVFNASVLDQNGVPVPLSAEQSSELAKLSADGVPRTIDLGGALGEYRVVLQKTTNGDALLIGLPLSDVRATVVQLGVLIAAIGFVGVAIAALAGAFVVRLALRPLQRVASTATRVSELPLDRGEVALGVRVPDVDADPATEVGQVGAALNRMLEHVASALSARQASENKVRTFVADASHELRTPLASIRGYSELTRRSGHDLPADVVHALGRVESESVRMTALVEELLLLARLDEGTELQRETVDLTRVVIDAVSDARAAGPDHTWQLEIPEEAVEVSGDRARLAQVVINLLSNARAHTPPGTVVTTSLERRATAVVLDVRDTGPGIDPALLPTIFERFVRGDSSRARASGGTGLGLAIAAAVVEAHGGSASVTSEPGATVFRVILPL